MGSRRVPSESAAGQQQPYKPTDATGSTVMSGSGGDPENALRFANKMLKKINMNCLQELTRVVRFRASEGGDLNQITECRKARTMKTLICLVASTVLILSTSGCATSSCNSGCETNGGLFSGRCPASRFGHSSAALHAAPATPQRVKRPATDPTSHHCAIVDLVIPATRVLLPASCRRTVPAYNTTTTATSFPRPLPHRRP
jgi:hypothetical protein